MKYLPQDRPEIEPGFPDLMRYFFPGQSYWTDVEGTIIFMNSDGTRNEDIQMPPKEEWDAILELMNQEWEVEKKRIELRKKLPKKDLMLWNLWKDIDSEVIPGKGGVFHQSILNEINKYSEGEDSILYPYEDYK